MPSPFWWHHHLSYLSDGSFVSLFRSYQLVSPPVCISSPVLSTSSHPTYLYYWPIPVTYLSSSPSRYIPGLTNRYLDFFFFSINSDYPHGVGWKESRMILAMVVNQASSGFFKVCCLICKNPGFTHTILLLFEHFLSFFEHLHLVLWISCWTQFPCMIAIQLQ